MRFITYTLNFLGFRDTIMISFQSIFTSALLFCSLLYIYYKDKVERKCLNLSWHSTVPIPSWLLVTWTVGIPITALSSQHKCKCSLALLYSQRFPFFILFFPSLYFLPHSYFFVACRRRQSCCCCCYRLNFSLCLSSEWRDVTLFQEAKEGIF